MHGIQLRPTVLLGSTEEMIRILLQHQLNRKKDSVEERNQTGMEANEAPEMPVSASLRYPDIVSSGNLN